MNSKVRSFSIFPVFLFIKIVLICRDLKLIQQMQKKFTQYFIQLHFI